MGPFGMLVRQTAARTGSEAPSQHGSMEHRFSGTPAIRSSRAYEVRFQSLLSTSSWAARRLSPKP
jgi:hypothetical protein